MYFKNILFLIILKVVCWEKTLSSATWQNIPDKSGYKVSNSFYISMTVIYPFNGHWLSSSPICNEPGWSVEITKTSQMI